VTEVPEKPGVYSILVPSGRSFRLKITHTDYKDEGLSFSSTELFEEDEMECKSKYR